MDQQTAFVLSQITLGDLPVIMSAIAAIGTASFGLMDATKAIKGGISNWGYGFILEALKPVEPILESLTPAAKNLPKANWINGLPKADQKMAIREMISLGLNETNATNLNKELISVNPTELAAAAAKTRRGEILTEPELAVVARFNAMLDLHLDAGFERADQRFRNASRFGAAVLAVFLSQAAAFTVLTGNNLERAVIGLVVGLVAVPLAPVAKDLTSAITTAVAAFKSVRK